MATQEEIQQKQALEGLANVIKQTNTATPCQMGIRICKVTNQGMTRYMRCYIGTVDVSGLVGNLTGYRISKAKTCYGALIVNGCGMDMCFKLQNTVSSIASRYGVMLFDPQRYRFIEGK